MKNNFWNQTLVYGVGFISLRAISFLLLPFYTRVLSPNIAGEVFVFSTFLAFMNAFFAFGMDSALLKFYNKHVFTTSIISIFLFCIPTSLVLYIMDNQISLFLFSKNSWNIFGYNWMLFAIIILILDAFSSRCMTLIRKIERPFYYLGISLINVLSSLYLTWHFISQIDNMELRLNGVILAMACVSIIQFLGLLPILFSNICAPFFDYDIFKKMLRFAWPFFPATIFFIIIELSDKIILKHLIGLHEVGLYGAGYKLAALILIIVRAFNLNWQPFYIREGNHPKKAKIKFGQIGTTSIIVLIFVVTLLSALWPVLIPLIVGSQYIDGGKIIPLIASAYGIYGLFILQMPSIYIKNQQKWSPLIWGLGALINIAGNFILIPSLGFVGAAISTLLAYASMSIFLIELNKKWYKITYDNQLINLTLYSSFIVFLSSQYLSFYQIYYNVFIFIVYSFIIVKLFNKSRIQNKVI